MTSHLRRPPLAALAGVLLLACGERAGPLDPAATGTIDGPALVKPSLPPGAALLLSASTSVEIIEPQWIRELREVSALFVQNPIGANGPLELEAQFDLAPAGTVQPGWFASIREAAWLDGGDGYKFDVSGPNDLPAVIQLLRVENGQVEDHTGLLESAAGTLRFLPNAKAWRLDLELTGIRLPADQATPGDIGGAVSGGLRIGETLVPAVIREGEAAFQGDALRLLVESSLEELDGGDSYRERIESAYHFTGLEPLDANGQPIDLRILYELRATGSIGPGYLRIIPKEAWQSDGTGGFAFAASGPDLAGVFRIVKEVDGQVTDLTSLIASVEAHLAFDAVAKAWLLEIELTSNEVIGPMYHPMLGAHAVTLDGGDSVLPAGLREAQVRLF